MPWTGEAPNAGFTTGEPWLPLNPDWRRRNVARQAAETGSMLGLHRALLRLRRAHLALSLGEIALLPADPHVLAYERRCGDDHVVVALNLTGEPREARLPPGAVALALRLSTVADTPQRTEATLMLRPDEAVVLGASPL